MSKAIKITNEVYLQLQRHQSPRETYSQVIARLLKTYELLEGVRDGLPASHFLQERPKKEGAGGMSEVPK